MIKINFAQYCKITAVLLIVILACVFMPQEFWEVKAQDKSIITTQ